MNKIVTDIKALKEETLKNLNSSKAANTVRAYKSDFQDFGLFCVKSGFNNLPADNSILKFQFFYVVFLFAFLLLQFLLMD